jgi:glycosyltransferase involved in cell wall biosynthesis
MKVLSYIKGNDGSSYHRVTMPNRTIDAEIREVAELTEPDLAWCDILHFSRHTIVAARFLDELKRKHGFKVILDNDDWWEVHPDHPKYYLWTKSNTALQVRSHMMYSDAVTCTHERMADAIRVYNPNVYVIPNALDYGKGQFRYKKQKTSDKVRLLYASTIMNYSNTAIIAGAMKKLKHLNIEIVIAGHHDSPLFDILVKNLTADGEIPHRFTKWSSPDNYMSGYEGDIGILPSKPTKFNSYKSNLKVLEYGALKIPAVVSECDPYLGMDVNYFNGENSFVEHVTRLVEDPLYRVKRGEDLYKFCKHNYNLADYADRRLSIYKEVYGLH